MINNILINADQSIPQGGRISINVSLLKILNDFHHYSLPKGLYIQIDISDEGNGIPDDIKDKIFNPYFTTKNHGNGLGLATAYFIIKKHNGLLTFSSKLGKGTTFSICLPASKTQKIKNNEIQDIILTKVGRILVLEDDPVVQKALSKMLTSLHQTFHILEKSESFIRYYTISYTKNVPYDISILDLTIPGNIDGVQVLRRILQINPKVKAILSSGYAKNHVVASFKDYGFVGLLLKPYKLIKLKLILHKLLQYLSLKN